MAVARRGLLALLGLLLAVLLGTGVLLALYYEPSPAQALGDPALEDAVPAVRVVHRLAGFAAVGVAVALATLVVARPAPAALRVRRLVPGALLAAVLVAALPTGFLLAWDQLALRAVTVGPRTDLRGVAVVVVEDVRFVLVDGMEVGTGTYLAWSAVHGVALPLLAGAALAALVLAGRRRTPAAGSLRSSRCPTTGTAH